MKNKRFLVLTLIVIFFSSMIFSQKNDPEQKNHERIKDTASFEKAKKSIYDGNWVFEATKYIIAGSDMSSRYGLQVVYYIVIEGDSCHYNLDSSLSTSIAVDPILPGINKGRCEIISIKEDRKGNIRQKMFINGSKLKADFNITLFSTGNSAVADIYPIRAKRSNMVRYSGRIIPLAESEYSKK